MGVFKIFVKESFNFIKVLKKVYILGKRIG